MKLSQLSAKPKLIQFVLDDEEIVQEFGEPIEFYSLDRQPMEVFMKLASANHQDMASMITIVRTLVLDEEGKEIIQGENTLPNHVLVKVIAKVVERLGK